MVPYARDAGWPEAAYEDARGGLLVKEAENEKQIVFRKGRWDEVPHEEKLRRALGHYRRARRLDPENHWLLPSIGDVLWKLGERQEAMRLFRQATELLPESSWPPMQLAGFLADEPPEDPARLQEALRFLELARRRGGEPAFVALKKARILETLGRTDEVLLQLRSALKRCPGDAWYSSDLASRALRFGLRAETAPLLERMMKNKEQRFAGIWNRIALLEAESAPRETITDFFRNCLPQLEEEEQRYEIYSRWREMDPEGFPLALGDEELSAFERLRDRIQSLRREEYARKLAVLEQGIGEVRGDERVVWLTEKARLLSASGENRRAGDIMTDLALDLPENSSGQMVRLRDAWRYYNGGGEREQSIRTARALYELGDTTESILAGIIWSNWWSDDTALARKALERMREYHPASPVTLQFDGRLSMEKWRYRDARQKILRARELSPERDRRSIDRLLADVDRGRSRETVTEFFRLGDTSRKHDSVLREMLMLPMEGWKLYIQHDQGRVFKPNLMSGTRSLLSRFAETGLGAEWPVRDGKMQIFLTQGYVDPEINGNYTLPLGIFRWDRRFGPLGFSFQAERNLMHDTPLAHEIGVMERVLSLDYYMEKARWISSGSVAQRRLNDNNTHHQGNFYLGYRLARLGAVLRWGWTYSNMDRAYDPAFRGLGQLPAGLVQPWEVYYAPNHVKGRNLGLEFERKIGPLRANIYVGMSRDDRPNSNAADVRTLSGTLSYPTRWGDLEYSFYGSKSEVDPLTDQTRKSKYVGREGTLRWRYRF